MLLLVVASLPLHAAAAKLEATRACRLESSSCTPHPSSADVQKRAARWKHLTVEPLMEFPAVFILRSFLKKKELRDLRHFAYSSEHEEIEGNMAAVDSPNSLSIASDLDERMATLAGLPQSSVEEGHFNVYKPGSILSVHQDNNNDEQNFLRIASYVIFIDGVGEGLVGGKTVFPLLNFSNSSIAKKVSTSELAKWDKALNGPPDPDNPKVSPGRHCMDSKTYRHPNLCKPLLKLAKRACATKSVHQGIVPKAGDAVLFYHLGQDSRLTNLALHGSCPVQSGVKITLAKFLRERVVSEFQSRTDL